MRGSLLRADPTSLTVLGMLPASGATGTYRAQLVVRVPISLTSTATAATNWINPEAGTVVAEAFWVLRTAGTGTFNAGRGSDGTGSASDIILAGTLAVGITHRSQDLGTAAGTTGSAGTAGVTQAVGALILLGPGGTGTNNSIIMVHSDTTTSTMAGELLVRYFPVT